MAADRSVTHVLQDILRNVQDILRSEVRLAKAEIRQEATQAATSALWMTVGVVDLQRARGGRIPRYDDDHPRPHTALGREGMTLAQVKAAERRTTTASSTTPAWTGEMFIEAIYADLIRARRR